MSFVFWHEEFTLGTGKKCPFQIIKDATNTIIAAVKVDLKAAQTRDAPAPGPVYPAPIPMPREWNGLDIVKDGAVFWAMKRTWEAARDNVKVYQFTDETAPALREPMKRGELVDGEYLVKSRGELWIVSKYGSRIKYADLRPEIPFLGAV